MKKLLLAFLLFQVALSVSAADPNWEYVCPYPHANTYWDAETDSAGNVYMVGDGGTVTVFDGSTMSDLGAPTDKALFGISVIASDDIWVCGGNRYADDSTKVPVILHYDGSSWTEHEGPTFYDSSYVCNDIYAAADDDVWVAGDGGTWLWHYDGATWDWYMNMPADVEGQFSQFFGFAEDDVYLVGDHGQILHYDGNSWLLEQKKETGTFSTNLLADVWGPDPEHVFATGNNAQIYSRVVSGTGVYWDELHWDGNWFGGDSLGTIWGPSANEIYAAGNGLFRFENGDLVELGENNRGFTMNKMVGGPGGNGAVIVGTNGSVWWYKNNSLNHINLGGRGVAQGFDGFPYGHNSVMFGTNQIYASTTNYLWLTDGNQATPFPSLPAPVSNLWYVGVVTGRPGKDIWVGVTKNQTAGYREMVFYWDGSVWHEANNIYTNPSAIWPLGNGNMYYFDKYAGMMHYNEGVSTTIDATVLGVNDIFGRADDDIYIVGNEGAVWHFDGQTVQAQISGVTVALTDVEGDEDEVYAIGADRTAIYKKSGAWKKVASLETREENPFKTIIGVGDNTFLAMLTTPTQYIGGDRGEIYTFKNGNLVSVRRGMTNSLEGVGKTESGRVIGWGSNGLLMEVTDSSVAEYRQVVDTKDSLSQVLGETKATLTFADGSSGVQMLSARAYSGPPAGLASDKVQCASQYWVVASSIPNVTATLSLEYDPGAVPEGLDESRASLYRNDGTGWIRVPSTVAPLASTISVSDATGLSTWALGWDFVEPDNRMPDLNSDQKVDEADLLELMVAVSKGDNLSDLNSDGLIDCKDVFYFATWWKKQ